MPDTIQMMTGTQGAAFIYINSRVQGIDVGDPSNFLDPTNPRTRFQALLADGTTVGSGCPVRQGFAPGSDGFDYWPQGEQLVFLPFTAEQAASNTNVTLTVEVIDSAMHYAKDQKSIFLVGRSGSTIDGGVGSALDAGVDAVTP